jgi:hypothetical protein
MSFTGKSPADTYKDIITVSNNNTGVDSTTRAVKTANGNTSSLSLSDRSLQIKSNTNNTTALNVLNASDTSRFSVDTTNNQVKAIGHHVNTQYAYFGVSSGVGANFVTNRHHVLSFGGNTQTDALADNFQLGTGTDPDTSFTTADGAGTDASVIVPCMWLVPDNITIDEVHSLEGGDNATGATTRIHLMSYTFNSGSTSALADGVLLAHNSDTTNAGSEQAYKSTFTVDSANVAANKVILATFLTTDITGDYSVSVIVKYHLT